jgi:YVTN family beta-propeller protein
MSGSSPPQAEPHRSPYDLAVLPGGRVLTANHTADSVSLVDVPGGKVLAEQRCGGKPSAVACSRDGERAAVSNLASGTITLLEVADDGLRVIANIAAGPLPRGLAFAHDGKTLYVAVSGRDEVAAIDCDSRKVTRRWPAAREPRQLAVSPDGKYLAAACGRSGRQRV